MPYPVEIFDNACGGTSSMAAADGYLWRMKWPQSGSPVFEDRRELAGKEDEE